MVDILASCLVFSRSSQLCRHFFVSSHTNPLHSSRKGAMGERMGSVGLYVGSILNQSWSTNLDADSPIWVSPSTILLHDINAFCHSARPRKGDLTKTQLGKENQEDVNMRNELLFGMACKPCWPWCRQHKKQNRNAKPGGENMRKPPRWIELELDWAMKTNCFPLGLKEIQACWGLFLLQMSRSLRYIKYHEIKQI